MWIMHSLDEARPAGPSTQVIAAALADWFSGLRHRAVPWLTATSRWQVISAEILLERMPPQQIRHLWPLLARWSMPSQTLAAQNELEEIAQWVGRAKRGKRILTIAGHLSGTPEQLADDEKVRDIPQVFQSVADLAILVVATGGRDNSEEPVLAGRGLLRVAARVTGEQVHRRNRLTDGRLAVARMIGYGDEARSAHLGLIELAASLCRPVDPLCMDCPLRDVCAESQAAVQQSSRLY